MKLRGWMILGAVFYLVGIVALVWILHLGNSRATISGHTVYAPHGWQVDSRSQTAVTFRQNELGKVDGGTITISDLYNRHANAQTFVSSWKLKLDKNGVPVYTSVEYHDPVMDQNGLGCVTVQWIRTHSFSIMCVTSTGRWGLVLMGKPSDIGGLDDLAKQTRSLGDR